MKDHVQQRILENQILILEMLPNALSGHSTHDFFRHEAQEAIEFTKAIIRTTV